MSSISPDRWRTLSRYLDEGLDVPAPDRDPWLASIAARDPELASELRGMLAEHDVVTRERFLDGTVLDPRVAAGASLAGQVVGSYRLLSLIGEGGSGSVWLAERCDGSFEGRAAVKLLNLTAFRATGEEHFRREGTILAGLRHPRIAHLIDAGVSVTGQPYLVLEHVDGQPIDQVLRRSRARRRSPPAPLPRRARCRGSRARQPDRPSRSEACQRTGQQGRAGQAARLRYCPPGSRPDRPRRTARRQRGHVEGDRARHDARVRGTRAALG